MDNNSPRRLQHRRTAGARLPEGAVLVTRASRWGNPFTVAEHGREGAIDRYRQWITTGNDRLPVGSRDRFLDPAWCRAEIHTLRGRDLACACPLDQPCHADVLLELANDPWPTEEEIAQADADQRWRDEIEADARGLTGEERRKFLGISPAWWDAEAGEAR